jgi:hypothetical protein
MSMMEMWVNSGIGGTGENSGKTAGKQRENSGKTGGE